MSLDDWLADRQRDRVAADLERRLRPRPASAGLIDLAGNDYLGLCTDPRVADAAAVAARHWGAGAGASRLVSGSLEIHRDLEARLAAFMGHEAALVLSTGYHANLSAVAALSDPDTLIVSDAHVHASLIDACRLARHGGLVIAPHNDTAAVATALRERTQRRALVLVESIYSVFGDAAPLAALAEAAQEHDATLIVDEAHAIGVAGPGGRGLGRADGLNGHPEVVTTVTLSKALGSQGGAVLGSAGVVEHLVNTARPFIYDTGLAPAATAAALESLQIIERQPELPLRARAIAADLAAALGVEPPAGAVLSVPMPGPAEALAAQAGFAEEGILVGCFRPPSVPDGISRLRITAHASLTAAQVAQVVRALGSVGVGR